MRPRHLPHLLSKLTRPDYHRFYSSLGKGSFPLALPRDFEFTPHSITFSNGHLAAPSNATTTLPVVNPATEQVLQNIQIASAETVDAAINDAQHVFTSGVWSRADATERFRVLTRIASILRENAAELAARTVPIGNGG
jgi:Aldehyde dehydrogenase family